MWHPQHSPCLRVNWCDCQCLKDSSNKHEDDDETGTSSTLTLAEDRLSDNVSRGSKRMTLRTGSTLGITKSILRWTQRNLWGQVENSPESQQRMSLESPGGGLHAPPGQSLVKSSGYGTSWTSLRKARSIGPSPECPFGKKDSSSMSPRGCCC